MPETLFFLNMVSVVHQLVGTPLHAAHNCISSLAWHFAVFASAEVHQQVHSALIIGFELFHSDACVKYVPWCIGSYSYPEHRFIPRTAELVAAHLPSLLVTVEC